MKKLLLTLFMVCVSVSSSSLYGAADKHTIGERVEAGMVRFHTDKYNLTGCVSQPDPRDRVGFYVVQFEKTNNLMFFCGTKRKTGDTVLVVFDEGI